MGSPRVVFKYDLRNHNESGDEKVFICVNWDNRNVSITLTSKDRDGMKSITFPGIVYDLIDPDYKIPFTRKRQNFEVSVGEENNGSKIRISIKTTALYDPSITSEESFVMSKSSWKQFSDVAQTIINIGMVLEGPSDPKLEMREMILAAMFAKFRNILPAQKIGERYEIDDSSTDEDEDVEVERLDEESGLIEIMKPVLLENLRPIEKAFALPRHITEEILSDPDLLTIHYPRYIKPVDGEDTVYKFYTDLQRNLA